jgi:hypothetical protein
MVLEGKIFNWKALALLISTIQYGYDNTGRVTEAIILK